MHRIEAYITLSLIFLAGFSVLYLPVLLILKKKGIGILRQLRYVGLFWSVFLIIFATILFQLVPSNGFNPDGATFRLDLVPFTWTEGGWARMASEVIPNILMFIPFGFFLPLVFNRAKKWYAAVGIALSLSIGIETIQFFIGRAADIDDVMLNTLGGIIGCGIYKGGAKQWNRCRKDD
jgi:glycopeptide antibiotics resistance protein